MNSYEVKGLRVHVNKHRTSMIEALSKAHKLCDCSITRQSEFKKC